jgi:alpha-methylacyl-CoA racemase
VRVVEFAGIGPVPMCAMLPADLGAEVLRIDRLEPGPSLTGDEARYRLLNRSRPSVVLDIKAEAGL